MLLSISLLCSGREKTTEKTLSSIKKITDAVGNSEIIVVDTGCNNASKIIIQKYADTIIPFNWCNDFAAARNIGLEAATGEWFMFIDDDEWFEDPTPIIEFFTSGIYKDYTRATYKVRNYANLEGTFYNDSINSRLFQTANKDTHKFVGKVHEYFVPVDGAVFNIDCHAEHYGYAFKTDEERRIHSLRNISLLKEMYYSEPDDIRWAQQLVPEYYSLREYSHMIDLCLETLSRFMLIDNKRINTIRPIFYLTLIRGYIAQANYSSAMNIFETALKDNRNSLIAQARLYEIGARLYWDSNRDYSSIIQFTNVFIDILRKPNLDKLLVENSVFFVKNALTPSYINEILVLGIVSAIYENQPAIAILFYNKLIWEDDNRPINIPPEIIDVFDALTIADYHQQLVVIFSDLIKHSCTKQLASDRIKLLTNNNSSNGQKLARYAASIESENDAILYLKLLNAIYNSSLPNNLVLIQNYFLACSEPFSERFIWHEIDKAGIKRFSVLKHINARHFFSMVNIFVANLSLEEVNNAINDFNDCFILNDARFDYLQLKLLESVITKTPIENWMNFDNLLEAISLWTQVTIGFYSTFIKESFLFNECPIVDAPSQVSLNLYTFLQYAASDFRHAFTILKSSIGIYPPLDDVLNLLAKLYADFYKEALNSN